jgi:multiple sugar transport system permease protein
VATATEEIQVAQAAAEESFASKALRFLARTPVQIFLVLVGLLWLVPTIGLFLTSLMPVEFIDSTGWWNIISEPSLATFENYRAIFENETITSSLLTTFWIAIGGTLLPIFVAALAGYAFAWLDFPGRDWLFIAVIALLVVPLQMALGLLLALVVNQPLRGRAFFRSAYYFPALTSSAAISVIAIYLFNADGLVNAGISAVIGHPFHQPWFGDPDTALETIVVLDAWTTSGTMMLFYLAALQSIPTDVYEAAAIDGGGVWRTFWKITFPLLKPAHFFVATVSVIGALKLFDQAFIISTGSGGPAGSTMTGVLYLYRVVISEFNFGYGAAVGVVLFLIIFSLTAIQRMLFGRAEIGY